MSNESKINSLRRSSNHVVKPIAVVPKNIREALLAGLVAIGGAVATIGGISTAAESCVLGREGLCFGTCGGAGNGGTGGSPDGGGGTGGHAGTGLEGGTAGTGGTGGIGGTPNGGGGTGGTGLEGGTAGTGGTGGIGGVGGTPNGGGGTGGGIVDCGPTNATIGVAPNTKYDYVWFRGDNIIQDSLANGIDELSSSALNGVRAEDVIMVQVKPNNASGEFGGVYLMPSCGLTVDARGVATDVTAGASEFLNMKNMASGWTTPPDSDADPGDFNGEFIGVTPYDKSTMYRYTIIQTN